MITPKCTALLCGSGGHLWHSTRSPSGTSKHSSWDQSVTRPVWDVPRVRKAKPRGQVTVCPHRLNDSSEQDNFFPRIQAQDICLVFLWRKSRGSLWSQRNSLLPGSTVPHCAFRLPSNSRPRTFCLSTQKHRWTAQRKEIHTSWKIIRPNLLGNTRLASLWSWDSWVWVVWAEEWLTLTQRGALTASFRRGEKGNGGAEKVQAWTKLWMV